MIKLDKRSKVALSVCIGVVTVGILFVGIYLFFGNSHKLLNITSECIAAYEKENIYISQGEQKVSFDQLKFAVDRNLELTDGVSNEYHKKYNALLEKKKQFYTLTDKECYELNFSAGTNEDLNLAKTDILQGKKSIQIWLDGDILRYSFVDSSDELSNHKK